MGDIQGNEKSRIFADYADPRSEQQKWVRAVRSGDEKAFRRIFETFYNPLLRFAYRCVHSEAIAEELVQDVFLWIWEKREEWKVEGKLQSYLFRAVKYKAVDYWRRERTRQRYRKKWSEDQQQYTSPELHFEEGKEEDTFAGAVQQAIEELPGRSRIIYKLSRLEGLTYREIAEVLEISPKTVESHMSRALNFLREYLVRHNHVLLMFNVLFAEILFFG